MPAERCFSVTVVGAAALAGAFVWDLAAALPADLAAGWAAAGLDAEGDLAPPLALGRSGGTLLAFTGSLVLVAFLAMSLSRFEFRLDTFPARRVRARRL